jgi:hypothetical protein
MVAAAGLPILSFAGANEKVETHELANPPGAPGPDFGTWESTNRVNRRRPIHSTFFAEWVGNHANVRFSGR